MACDERKHILLKVFFQKSLLRRAIWLEKKCWFAHATLKEFFGGVAGGREKCGRFDQEKKCLHF